MVALNDICDCFCELDESLLSECVVSLLPWNPGGLVVARSVKFLGKLEATADDQDTRERWWEELRAEIKNHAKSLCCTHIVGYSESCAVYGDVCVLSAVGTAASVKALAHPSLFVDALTVPESPVARGPEPGSRGAVRNLAQARDSIGIGMGGGMATASEGFNEPFVSRLGNTIVVNLTNRL